MFLFFSKKNLKSNLDGYLSVGVGLEIVVFEPTEDDGSAAHRVQHDHRCHLYQKHRFP